LAALVSSGDGPFLKLPLDRLTELVVGEPSKLSSLRGGSGAHPTMQTSKIWFSCANPSEQREREGATESAARIWLAACRPALRGGKAAWICQGPYSCLKVSNQGYPGDEVYNRNRSARYARR
jgi:hypothetical protein